MNNKVVSKEEWIAARKSHLAKEKEFTQLRDQLSEDRRNLPWVKVNKDYVFNGEKKGAYLENDPSDPKGAYGISKLEGEKAIQDSGCKHYIVRTAWLYGKNGPNFVNTMLKLFKERKVVNVVEDQEGSPTYSKDLASALIEIAEKRENTKIA